MLVGLGTNLAFDQKGQEKSQATHDDGRPLGQESNPEPPRRGLTTQL
jgi:hypothetical protein